FRGGAAEIAADDDGRRGIAAWRARAAGESRGPEMPVALAVLIKELPEFLLAADEPARAFVGLELMLAMGKPPSQPLGPRIGRVGGNVACAEDDAAEARIIERLLGNVDQGIGIAIGRQRNMAFRP